MLIARLGSAWPLPASGTGGPPAAGLTRYPTGVGDRRIIVVAAGESIAEALRDAPAGSQIVVEPGEYREQLALKSRRPPRQPRPRGATSGCRRRSDGRGRRRRQERRGAELVDGFRIVGDAATPLGTGHLVENSTVSISTSRSAAPRAQRVESPDRASTLMASDIHDNPARRSSARDGATPRMAHNMFARNGSSSARAPLVVEAAQRRASSATSSSACAANVHGSTSAARSPRATGSSPQRGPSPGRHAAASDDDDRLQQVGPYEILREIGRGGMAVVFLAPDTRDDRECRAEARRGAPIAKAAEILEAEQFGAELQEASSASAARTCRGLRARRRRGLRLLLRRDGVPRRRNLSDVIAAARCPPARAADIAIELAVSSKTRTVRAVVNGASCDRCCTAI